MDWSIAEEIAEFFPKLFGQPSVTLKAVGASGEAAEERSLNIGVVLSGGQAAGGHNVISGLFGEGLLLCFLLFIYFNLFFFSLNRVFR